jgi:hypothetical protein
LRGGTNENTHGHNTILKTTTQDGNPKFGLLDNAGGYLGRVIIAADATGTRISTETAKHAHTVTTTASTTGGNSDNTTNTGSGTAFDNRPFHENFYGWVRIS